MRHRLLDRSLTYTAITQGQHQALFVGDEAVVKMWRAQRRMTGLLSMLAAKIDALVSR